MIACTLIFYVTITSEIWLVGWEDRTPSAFGFLQKMKLLIERRGLLNWFRLSCPERNKFSFLAPPSPLILFILFYFWQIMDFNVFLSHCLSGRSAYGRQCLAWWKTRGNLFCGRFHNITCFSGTGSCNQQNRLSCLMRKWTLWCDLSKMKFLNKHINSSQRKCKVRKKNASKFFCMSGVRSFFVWDYTLRMPWRQGVHHPFWIDWNLCDIICCGWES